MIFFLAKNVPGTACYECENLQRKYDHSDMLHVTSGRNSSRTVAVLLVVILPLGTSYNGTVDLQRRFTNFGGIIERISKVAGSVRDQQPSCLTFL
jgi:hypothetical protein